MSLINDFNSEERKYFKQMSTLHLLTKKYLLIAEEVAENGELFLQPLKEHRDAYDHLMRCYSISFMSDSECNMTESDKEHYILENINKAFGHEYRAFFDTADWLTYMLRKWIRIKLQEYGEQSCQEKFDDYNTIKNLINNLPEKIAKLRGDKDVGRFNSKSGSLIEEIKTYADILDELISLKKRIVDIIGL